MNIEDRILKALGKMPVVWFTDCRIREIAHELDMRLEDTELQPTPAPDSTLHPEAIQPLPAAVEAEFKYAEDKLKTGQSPYDKGVTAHTFTVLRSRLAALWPKAGQVPSVTVTQLVAWAEQEYPDLYNRGREIPGDFFTRLADHLSRMGQPSPVTDAEQLMVQLAGCSTAALGFTKEPTKQGDYGWSPAYQDVLDLRRKYDALQSPVTAEKAKDQLRPIIWNRLRFPDFKLSPDAYDTAVDAIIDEMAEAFPSLGQGRLTVSKEQWERLVSRLESRHVILQPAIVFRQWLKDELGMEVADD